MLIFEGNRLLTLLTCLATAVEVDAAAYAGFSFFHCQVALEGH